MLFRSSTPIHEVSYSFTDSMLTREAYIQVHVWHVSSDGYSFEARKSLVHYHGHNGLNERRLSMYEHDTMYVPVDAGV